MKWKSNVASRNNHTSLITALLPVYNCEKTIRACLESVKWVDRIFVVDSFSTDRTLEICREYTDWIVQHEYVNSATQKNWAMDQISTEWTLQIDSDERLEPELSEEIMATLSAGGQADGYRTRIKNLVWGKWVKGCGMYPDSRIRVFKTAKGRWSDREVHAHVQGINNVVDLRHHCIHEDLTDLSQELQQFARQVVVWESKQYFKDHRRWCIWNVTLRPLALFCLFYFRHGGFREGFRGFYLSVYRSFYSFMVYSRLYEMEIKSGLRK
jgi:glycosyltransferase involved in cell wall biosynthesis